MAGGNWQEIVFGVDGAIIKQPFFTPGGVEIHVNKNWIDLDSYEGEKIVPRVWSGQLIYKDVRVWAERGPREGVYAVIESERSNFIVLGVGLFGHDEHTGAWMGVRELELRHLLEVAARADVGMPDDPACNWLGGGEGSLLQEAMTALCKRLDAGHFKDGFPR